MRELDCEEGWAPKNWCFWTVVLEKTLESPSDCREIQPVHSKGDQPWDFFGRNDVEAETPILWPPDVKGWLIWKDSDAGKDWGQEENWTTEDEMVGWHHRLNGHGFGWTLGVGDGQGGLACCSSWDHKESDTTKWLNWTDILRSGIVGLFDNSKFNFLRSQHVAFHSGCTILHFYQECIRFQFLCIFPNIYSFVLFFKITILMDLKWYLICFICSPLWSDLAYIHILEKEMAAHSSTLDWRIPGTEEPGGLPSMGSHRFGHDWSDLATTAAAMIIDVEYIFMCLLLISISSLEYYLFKFFAHFKIGFVVDL